MGAATPKVLHRWAAGRCSATCSPPSRRSTREHLLVVVGHGRDAGRRRTLHAARRRAGRPGDAGRHRARRAGRARRPSPRSRARSSSLPGDTPLLHAADPGGAGRARTSRRRAAATLLTAQCRRPDRLRPGRPRRRRRVAAIVEQQGRRRRRSGGSRDQHQRLRLRRRPRCATALAQLDDRQRAGRGVPHRRRRPASRRRARPVGAVVAAGPRRDARRQRPGAAGRRWRRVLRDRIVDAGNARRRRRSLDPQTTWIDVDVVLEPDATIAPQHPAARQHDDRGGRGRRARTRTLTDMRGRRRRDGRRSARRRRRDRRRGATVGPFTLPAPRHGARRGARKVGAFVEIKNAQIGAGTRCRTCPTSATRRSASAATSARARSSSTTTACDEAPHDGRRRRPGRQRQHAGRAGRRSATAPTPRPGR